MPPKRTTTATANECYSTAVSQLGESAAMDVRGHCGMPINNATKQAGGTEAYVSCFTDALRAAPDGTGRLEAARLAAQQCTQRQ